MDQVDDVLQRGHGPTLLTGGMREVEQDGAWIAALMSGHRAAAWILRRDLAFSEL
ncbi:hypothetical protein GCM10028801_37990 [Nocardioides maradonensis]